MAYLTVEQIAAELNCSGTKIRCQIRAKQLPAINIAPKGSRKPSYRVRVEDFEAMKASCEIQPQPSLKSRRLKFKSTAPRRYGSRAETSK